jgi:predicted MPP superfamily phosphohydrolase
MKHLIAILFLTTAISVNAQNNVAVQPITPKLDFACQPYLQNLNQNGITISWTVNLNSTSRVEYGETEQLGMKAIHSQSGMIDVSADVQKVVLTNLKPGTRYFYSAVSKEVKTLQAYKVVFGDSIRSKVYSFTTPSPNSQNFSFLAFNDLHSKPQFVEDAVKREPGFKFVMLDGDILDNIPQESDITEKMLIPFCTYFASETPFFLTRGNHETRGPGARILAKYIDTPTENYYYSFTYGNTHFVVLDCGEDKPDNNQYYFGLADYDNYRLQEALWLKKEVQTPAYKNAQFRVICIHMPITLETNLKGADHGMKDCSEKFAPILNDNGADLLLCGHTHAYTVIRPQKGVTNFPIIVGGGPFTDKIGAKTTYTVVNINNNLLTATLKKANGEVIDKVEVKSPTKK